MRIKWFSAVRVTGLLLVLLYHYFKTIFPGGFVGVDIFFTFSGYLITALLLDEFTTTNKIDYVSFLRRRFYRIVPPLVLMVLVVMPFTLLVRRDFVADIGRQIATTLGFTTNLYELFIGANYENQFIPHLFLHTWSLAIEVHFYLLWGIIIWLASKHVSRTTQLRGVIFLTSGTFFALSFLTMFIGAFLVDNFSTLYFSSIAHAFPFFVGSFLATVTGIKDTTKKFRKQVTKWQTRQVFLAGVGAFVGLVLLGLFLDFNHIFTYLFGFLLSSILGGVMICCTRILHEKSSEVDEPKVLTFLSDTSYGIYLFHWPFLVIFNQFMPLPFSIFFTTLFSVILASLSYYVIEPVLLGKTPSILGLDLEWQPYKKYGFGVLAVLTLITLVISIFAPKVGQFETDLRSSALEQANSNMSRTHTLVAGDATAMSSLMIIGDSVTLRASEAIKTVLPEAQLDAAVSRGFDSAYETFQNYISNDSLPLTVILAVGVNSLYNYQEDLEQFMVALPKGHRLIIVTPYNSTDGRVSEVRNYELDLTHKYDYVTIADWYQTGIANQDIWGGTDGVHFSDTTTKGAELYAKTIEKAVEEASKKPAKK
ncbi:MULTISPECIES: acyltransferase family protein [Streptococcus]|uniref:Acyltransferase family protein n=1 Tax=Streptococcus caledonicus TaxID=2614158 RepID=A0ABW0UA66_9STRE|nr:acyltransferase family protein [Streptococcus sp. S784/96/1]